MRVSASDLRASSTPASAACSVAWAPASAESEVSSAVGEIKPCATNALLLLDWRWAMSTWVRAAIACCSAWRKRKSYSVVSNWATTWPARTLSPSRTATAVNSAATLALTTAVFTALSEPETSSPWVSATLPTASTSDGLRSRVCTRAEAALAAAALAVAAAPASGLRSVRAAINPTTAKATSGSATLILNFMAAFPFWVLNRELSQVLSRVLSRAGQRAGSARPAPD